MPGREARRGAADCRGGGGCRTDRVFARDSVNFGLRRPGAAFPCRAPGRRERGLVSARRAAPDQSGARSRQSKSYVAVFWKNSIDSPLGPSQKKIRIGTPPLPLVVAMVTSLGSIVIFAPHLRTRA